MNLCLSPAAAGTAWNVMLSGLLKYRGSIAANRIFHASREIYIEYFPSLEASISKTRSTSRRGKLGTCFVLVFITQSTSSPVIWQTV